jgi:adenine-specific DNA-methyltransferase
MRPPTLLAGPGQSVLGDATELVDTLPHVDLAYLDPPYNQHRYFTNYHVWETLVRWDEPEAYGIARKRIDARDKSTKSVFNRKREMPEALASVISRVRARVVVVSYNDESWVDADEILATLRGAGHEDVRLLAFDSKRYVGAQIGIHNPAGVRVGSVSHLRNTEYVFVAGPADLVAAAALAAQQ